MSSQRNTLITPEEYLAIERQAPYKSEYYRGEMFALAGAGRIHNLLVANLIGNLHSQLRSRECSVYPSDMRVRAAELFTYPDVLVVCGAPRFMGEPADTLLNPSFIAEVLSPSTEANDRGRNFEHYRLIESLREYLLIASDRMHADLYTRQPDGTWLLKAMSRPEEILELQCCGCRLSLADLYEKIELP